MENFEEYEKTCKKIINANKHLLDEFKTALRSSGLSEKTIKNHVSNIDFYLNEFLLYEDSRTAENGVYSIGVFLGDWFVRKAIWANPSSIRNYGASFKKFYTFMHNKGLIDKEDLDDLKQTIKEEMPEWIEAVD